MLLSYYFCVLCTQNIPSLKNAAKVIQEAEENGKSLLEVSSDVTIYSRERVFIRYHGGKFLIYQGCCLTGTQQHWSPKFFAAAANTLPVGLLTSWLLPFWAPRNIC